MSIVATIFEKSGLMEVFMRCTASAIEPIKRPVKRMLRGNNNHQKSAFVNPEQIAKLRDALLNSGVKSGDIVIIHSSLDGLHSLGLPGEKVIELVLDVFSSCTVVFVTFPIEPRKTKDVYSYDPQKTLCGTGMLPNLFLKFPGVVRSSFPYNSLAAIGRQAEAMMANDEKSFRPHDHYSAWEYCRQHHAKILFLGTTSREANTMAIHMIPDIMEEAWPIEKWYIKRNYKIKIGETITNRTIEVQDGFWYQYVNEYKTDKILRDAGLLRRIGFDDIPLEIVDDSMEMSEFLIERCRKGNLMYRIPHKYWRK